MKGKSFELIKEELFVDLNFIVKKLIYKKDIKKLLIKRKNYCISNMIQAEISIYPIATRTTSVSFYIAKAIESIENLEGVKYEINSMGTVLEAENIDIIYEASKKMMDTVHNLGIGRVEVIIKIDSRKDKHLKIEEKIESIKKYLDLKK